MKTSSNKSSKWITALVGLIFMMLGDAVFAQSPMGVIMSNYGVNFFLGCTIVVVALTTIVITLKASRILSQNGQSIFEVEFPIFKRLARSSKTVAFVLSLIVLWGIYLVITYSAG